MDANRIMTNLNINHLQAHDWLAMYYNVATLTVNATANLYIIIGKLLVTYYWNQIALLSVRS